MVQGGVVFPVLTLSRFQLTAETQAEEREVMNLFFSLVEQKLAVLRQWNPAQPDEEWRRATHYLKGMASNLGMEALSEACRVAELRALPAAEEVQSLLAAIEAALADVHGFFETRLASSA